MRIITWNCHHGSILHRHSLLEKFKSDIIFLQEVQCPPDQSPQVQWFGTNKKKGHAIIVSNDLAITPYCADEIDPFVVPIAIEGNISIHALMVWTQKHGEYIEELQAPLSRYHDFLLEKPSVMAGDFNSNAIWDKNHRVFGHSTMVSHLDEKLGLISAYHERMKCRHGAERHPTLYHCYKPNRPFHIDYCFVPKIWKISNVAVGDYKDWITESDHCPLIVDVEVTEGIKTNINNPSLLPSLHVSEDTYQQKLFSS